MYIILHGTVMTKKENGGECRKKWTDFFYYYSVYVYVKTVLIENVIIFKLKEYRKRRVMKKDKKSCG
jgi:hypothetical protein